MRAAAACVRYRYIASADCARGVRLVRRAAAMSGQLRLDTMFALARKRGADEAELDAPLGAMQRFAAPEKRCTHIVDGKGTRCKWWFPEADEHAWCKTCRVAVKKYKDEHREEVREKSLEYWHGEKHDRHLKVKATYRDGHREELRESNAVYHASAARAASRARERASGKKKLANARYREKHAVKLKEKQDEWNRSPMGLLCRALYKMVTGAHWNPQSFPALGSFQSNEEARAHFESFFEASGWMAWENRGAHAKENEYDQVWNIGHWLPRAIFDPTHEEDLRRCWNPDNLFPQCAKKNCEFRDVLIYTDEELLERRHLWPVGANDDLDQLKSLFRYTAV